MSTDNGNLYTKAAANGSTTSIKRNPSSIADMGVLLMNGLGSGAPLPKLSSFTPARDLTLGGRGGSIPKKIFAPNLNVIRNKNANVKTSKDTTRGRGKSERGSRGGNATRGGRGTSNSSLIQTAGVFSEGAGAVNIRKVTSSSSYSRNSDDSPSLMRKPTLVKSDVKKIDTKADAAQIRELLGDSDDDDFLEDKTDLEHVPIKLNEAKWKSIKDEMKRENQDLLGAFNGDVKTDEDSAVAVAQKIQSLHVKHEEQRQHTVDGLPRYPQNIEEFLDSTQNQQIFLMQLPDALPCEEMDSDGKESVENKVTTLIDSMTAPAPTYTPNSRTLKQMEEGQVGKIVRYKSGKTKLLLGDSYFDLDVGMETGFLQDLMSINTNREERSGNMVNLGPVQAKITVTPDWENLLKRQFRDDNT